MKKPNFEKDFARRIKEDLAFQKRHELDSFAFDISRQIYKARTEKGYTQTKLAKLLEIKQSNVARLENGQYSGYSLSTLTKIAKALDSVLSIQFIPVEAPEKVVVSQNRASYNPLFFVSTHGTKTLEEDYHVSPRELDNFMFKIIINKIFGARNTFNNIFGGLTYDY